VPHIEKAHIVCIASNTDKARDLCRRFGVPLENAISGSSPTAGRGRVIAGYILEPGYLPPTDFMRGITPCLVGSPHFSVKQLEEMLVVAREREAERKLFWDKINDTTGQTGRDNTPWFG
jgi:hypothetical protein